MTFNNHNSKAAKITAAQVLALRSAYAEGATQASLSRKYGISGNQVGRIVRGESWQGLTGMNLEGRYRMSEPSLEGVPDPTPEQMADFTARMDRLAKEMSVLDASVNPAVGPVRVDERERMELSEEALERVKGYLGK